LAQRLRLGRPHRRPGAFDTAIHNFYIINEAIPVGGAHSGRTLACFLVKGQSAEGAKEDEEGLKSLRKTMDRLMKTTILLKKNNRI